MKLPIQEKLKPVVSTAEIKAAEKIAETLIKEKPELDFRRCRFGEFLINEDIGDQPTLHLDDFSEVPIIGKIENSRILQQRARLRADDGDLVAQSRMIERGYSDYCEYYLGLGRVTWIYPAIKDTGARQIALDCWHDRRLRRDLEQAIRQDGLRYIHPHVSTKNV